MCEFANSLQSYTILMQCNLFYGKQEALVSLVLLVCFLLHWRVQWLIDLSSGHRANWRRGAVGFFYGSSLEPAYDCSQFPQIVLVSVKAQRLSHFQGKAEDY